MSKLNHGIVEVEANGVTYELRPTLKAFQKIQVSFDGLRGAVEAVQKLNVDNAAAIISAGAGLDRKEREEVLENVFQAGVVNVIPEITEFLVKLMDPNGTADSDDEEPPKKE